MEHDEDHGQKNQTSAIEGGSHSSIPVIFLPYENVDSKVPCVHLCETKTLILLILLFCLQILK